MNWISNPIQAASEQYRTQAQAQQNSLTKPLGSLGRLEQIAVDLAAIQSTNTPAADTIGIHIFAADHGVAAENVSAFPQVVTGEMIRNFAAGGAAISVLAQQLRAPLAVHNLGTVNVCGINGLWVENETLKNVTHYQLGRGTANFCQQAAMTAEQLTRALEIGKLAAEASINVGCNIIIGGEMGIANTTSATALGCALLQLEPSILAGPGTGLNEQGIAHKCNVIAAALSKHMADKPPTLTILQRLGGFEIAALVGFYIRAAQLRCAVLVDGFICSIAALVATKIAPQCQGYLFLSHQSAEPGHHIICQALKLEPLLNLGMRLGEGSGAAVAANLLQTACALHNGMATFDQAAISKE
tara:strand:- start:1432 stop:2502 length:1071 start_codon:yes stop_codon:yes gene_type:complete